jgi:hypothetical protein
MKRLMVGLAALSIALVVPLAAGATRAMPVTLTFTLNLTSASQASGTWTAETLLPGLAGKSGTAVETFRTSGKGKVVHGKKVVSSGSDGSFLIVFNGRFVIKNGKGIYKGLHGTGKIHATLDAQAGTISATYTGKAHFDSNTVQHTATSQNANDKANGKSK